MRTFLSSIGWKLFLGARQRVPEFELAHVNSPMPAPWPGSFVLFVKEDENGRASEALANNDAANADGACAVMPFSCRLIPDCAGPVKIRSGAVQPVKNRRAAISTATPSPARSVRRAHARQTVWQTTARAPARRSPARRTTGKTPTSPQAQTPAAPALVAPAQAAHQQHRVEIDMRIEEGEGEAGQHRRLERSGPDFAASSPEGEIARLSARKA
jgi:hypothetical protein